VTVTARQDYLAELDGRVSAGVASLPVRFRHRHAGYVLGRQNPDGGFSGRQGPSDVYYTGFGLRCADVLRIEEPTFWSRAAAFLGNRSSPGDVVDVFSVLSSRALLRRHGVSVETGEKKGASENPGGHDGPGDTPSALRVTEKGLEDFHTDSGGYAKPGDPQGSVYHTFLVALSYQLMGREMPEQEAAVRFVRSHQQETGGFADLAGAGEGKKAGVNPTAAAVGVLSMFDALDEATATKAARFVLSMQRDDGGFAAHAEAPFSDLLSTFTAAVVLSRLGLARRARLGSMARFAGSLALPDGGFRGAAADDAGDVEYTYYGLGTLGLLALEAGCAKGGCCSCDC